MSILSVPTTGFGRSIRSHNVELDAMCDWVEGSVLFGEEKVSKRELVDVLLENNVYDDQDFATERVDSAWSELKSRQNTLEDTSPFVFQNQFITLKESTWEATPGHAFCVMLSLLKWYDEWSKRFSRTYTEQGSLFEQFVFHSTKAHFPGWKLALTGWSATNANKIDSVVDEVASLVGEPRSGEIYKWTKATKNEAGLDMVCCRPFNDTRGGRPVYLFQCASGKNFEEKLHTPNLQLWTRLVEFTARELPIKAFATPFAFLATDFTQHCNLVGGLLMDRYRLLEASRHKSDWIPPSLGNQLEKWTRVRVEKLPFLEA